MLNPETQDEEAKSKFERDEFYQDEEEQMLRDHLNAILDKVFSKVDRHEQ